MLIYFKYIFAWNSSVTIIPSPILGIKKLRIFLIFKNHLHFLGNEQKFHVFLKAPIMEPWDSPGNTTKKYRDDWFPKMPTRVVTQEADP